jgi:glutamyl-tRNA reductase
MNLILTGTSYKCSPIELREKLSFSGRRLKDSLHFLKERGVLNGAVILSTCNRVEIYASVEDSKMGIQEIEDFISIFQDKNKGITPYFYIYEDKKATEHLFSVTCGLDSLILGETQISGQVKHAILEACSVDFVDELLINIFHAAFSVAKKVHKDTKISEGKVSVGSVTIDFIKEKIGKLSDKNILIIGVGKVTELVLRYFKRENPNVIFVSNRTYEKAEELARQLGTRAVRFNDLKQCLKKADVVISATASPHFIIKKETLEEIRRELLIIDLAVPRDVEPSIKEIRGVALFCLEDLESVIRETKEKKIQEARKVIKIINSEVEELWKEVTELEQEPVLLL